jgi:hypothetical protein
MDFSRSFKTAAAAVFLAAGIFALSACAERGAAKIRVSDPETLALIHEGLIEPGSLEKREDAYFFRDACRNGEEVRIPPGSLIGMSRSDRTCPAPRP